MDDMLPLDKVYPWRCYFARNFDMVLLGLFALVIMLITVVLPILIVSSFFIPIEKLLDGIKQVGETRSMALDYLITLFFVFPVLLIEGIMIKFWGTTPGKALFGIRVITKDLQFLSLKESLIRPFRVFIIGQGGLLPVLSLVTYLYSYKYLKKHRTAYWDQDKNIAYCYAPISSIRELIGGVFTVGFVLFLAFVFH